MQTLDQTTKFSDICPSMLC